MGIRGVVVSTLANGTVLKIDIYFCRRGFFLQNSETSNFFHSADVGHKIFKLRPHGKSATTRHNRGSGSGEARIEGEARERVGKGYGRKLGEPLPNFFF